jgi:hypothetical protein
MLVNIFFIYIIIIYPTKMNIFAQESNAIMIIRLVAVEEIKGSRVCGF